MSLYAMLKGRGPSGFGYASTAEEVTEGLDLKGRVILITGCNSGIGLESMRVLAARGATIVAAARTMEKAQAAIDTVRGDDHIPVACELSDPASVRACVESITKQGITLDVLLLNAGIMALPKLKVEHGLELQFLTNHIGHYILTLGLLDSLAPNGRVVVLSSAAHQNPVKGGIDFENLDGSKGYSPWSFYGQSKLANLLFARELARHFEGSERVAVAVHPGVIATNLTRNIGGVVEAAFRLLKPLTLKSIPQGASTQTWAAVHPDAAAHSGEYLADVNVAKTTAHGRDMELAKRLWDESERIVTEL